MYPRATTNGTKCQQDRLVILRTCGTPSRVYGIRVAQGFSGFALLTFGAAQFSVVRVLRMYSNILNFYPEAP